MDTIPFWEYQEVHHRWKQAEKRASDLEAALAKGDKGLVDYLHDARVLAESANERVEALERYVTKLEADLVKQGR